MIDSGVAFAVPTAQLIKLVHPSGTTVPITIELNISHTEEVRIFRKYKDTNTSLKNQLLHAVRDDYVVELNHAKLGYESVTTLDIIDQLRDQYGMIEP